MQTDKSCELSSAPPEILAREAVKVLLEKKGIDVKLYDVRESGSITDFYIIATGRSLTHVAALADDMCMLLAERGRTEERIEGKRGNSWILVDYLDVIVNIFDKEAREFYNFERLLDSKNLVNIDNLIVEVDNKFDTNKNQRI